MAPATTQFRAAGAGPPANTDAATKAGSMQGTGTGSTSGGGAAGANGTGSFEFGFGMAETTAGRAVAAGQDKKPASSFSFGFAL